MTRTTIFIASLIAALAFPAIASASCGTSEGSFTVTCEKGVKVFRHNSLSARPRGLSASRLKAKAIEARQDADKARLESKDRYNLRKLALQERALDIKERQLEVSQRSTRRRFAYSIARPIRVKSTHAK